jgi:hypothetical protein
MKHREDEDYESDIGSDLTSLPSDSNNSREDVKPEIEAGIGIEPTLESSMSRKRKVCTAFLVTS